MGANYFGRSLQQRLQTDAAGLPLAQPRGAVTEADIADLPPTVQRYFRFMGSVGRPEVTSFRAHLTSRFRLRPGARFLPAEFWQYNTVDPIARVFWMRISFFGVPMIGVDRYVAGRGRMLGKLLDLVTVADGQGPEFDIGELTTWLNDAVMMAPSMLLRAGAGFTAEDEHCFEVTLSDAGRTVRARITVDDRGAPVDFRSDDRYADLPDGLVRAVWATPIEGWQHIDGQALPTTAAADWHLPTGPYRYAELRFAPDAIVRNPSGAGDVAV